MNIRKCFLAFFLSLISLSAGAADSPFIVEKVLEGLDHPWSIAILPDDRGMLITERPGTLLLFSAGELRRVEGLPRIAAVGQGGMLEIVLSSDFPEDSTVFFSYSEGGREGYGTAVARGRLVVEGGRKPRLEGVQTIYSAFPRSEGGRHFGSRLVFDSEGYLYVTLGERGSMQRAQDPMDPYGSVLRLNPDGSIPDDNPFSSGGERPGQGAPEIWTYGHRNAQGMAVHPGSGKIWIHEHGPKGGDEINILSKGANYGWPVLTFGIDYDGSTISRRTGAPGYEDPLLHWTPSIAPSGMAFYEGDAFPAWRGDLFVGALAGRHLRRIVIRGGEVIDQQILLAGDIGRIRDVRVGPDGGIWLITDEDNGGLYRVIPAGD